MERVQLLGGVSIDMAPDVGALGTLWGMFMFQEVQSEDSCGWFAEAAGKARNRTRADAASACPERMALR